MPLLQSLVWGDFGASPRLCNALRVPPPAPLRNHPLPWSMKIAAYLQFWPWLCHKINCSWSYLLPFPMLMVSTGWVPLEILHLLTKHETLPPVVLQEMIIKQTQARVFHLCLLIWIKFPQFQCCFSSGRMKGAGSTL